MSTTILDLSSDNFQEIVKYLDISDFGSIRITCRSILLKTLKFWRQWIPQESILSFFLNYQNLSLEKPTLHGIYLRHYCDKVNPMLGDLKFEELDISKNNIIYILNLIHNVAFCRHLKVLHLPAILAPDRTTILQIVVMLRIPNLKIMIGTSDLVSICCVRGYYRILEALINNLRINVNEPCIEGSTPLIMAIEAHRDSIVNLLLDSGADVNLADHCGKVPLMAAIQVYNHDAIKLLHSKKADGKRIDTIQRTIYDYADNVSTMALIKGLYPPDD